MTANAIKWGILGTSYISEVMARAIQSSHQGQLVAIASRTKATAKEFAQKFSIPSYSDYETLLANPEVTAIYIGLPNHLHKEWIINCAQAGKHTLCEKPYVLNAQEAKEVFAVLQKSNTFSMEALMYRCHPFTKKLQTVINHGVLGDIKLINATYTANIAAVANKTAGGSIRNLGCYPVSLVRLLMKQEPIEMKATGRWLQETNHDHQASTILKFPNDVMAVISTADDMSMSWQFEIYGTQGKLIVHSNPWLPDVDNNKFSIHQYDTSNTQEVNVIADKSLYTYQIDMVNDCINQGELECHDGMSWQDSLGNIAVLEAWLKQVKLGA